MKLDVCALSDTGVLRSVNQDCCFCNGVCICGSDNIYCENFDISCPSLFAVFDGMGGHLYGDRASRIALDVVDSCLKDYDGGSPREFLQSVCDKANDLICTQMLDVVKGAMGSTASMLLFQDGMCHVCNIGDSPVLLVRGADIKELFCEHTGRLNYEIITGKKSDRSKKFELTQYLGIHPDEMAITPHYETDKVTCGDVFIVCSDGLTDEVSYENIVGVVSSCDNAQSIAESLLKQALDNGGRDNITVVVCKVV